MNEPNAEVAGAHPEPATDYPVQVFVELPERYERSQLLLRFLVMILLSALHQPFGGISCGLYFVLPVVAAVLISQRGGSQFISTDAGWMRSTLEWIMGLFAYLMLVTDRVPLDASKRSLHLKVRPGGTPTVGTALVRFFTSLPHVLVLSVLGMLSALIWIVAALSVLFTESYPPTLQRFQRNLLAWTARFFVYHCSLIEDYPPFSLYEERPTYQLPASGE